MISFESAWPKDFNLDRLRVEVVFSVNSNDGDCLFQIMNCHRIQTEYSPCNVVAVTSYVKINPQHLYGQDRSFTLQADILVEMIMDPEKDDNKYLKEFAKDIKSTFLDDKNSDSDLISL